jgi:hypothetical protein
MADEILSGLRGIKTELRAVQDQMIGLDAGSQEFVKLSQKAGELRDRMKDVKEAVNANAGPAISSFSNNLSIARGQLGELDLEGFSESLRRMGSNVASINFNMFKDGIKAASSALIDIGSTIVTNPIMLLGGVLAGLVIYWDDLTSAIFKTNEAQKLNTEVIAEMNKAISGELVSLEKNKALLNDNNISQEKRVSIINELKKAYPEYLGNIDAETISNDKLSAALSNVNKALFLKYEIQAREKTLQPLFEKRLQLENDLAAAEQARIDNQNKIAEAQEKARTAGGAAAFAQYQEIEKLGNLETGQVEKIKADIDATSKLINDSISKISQTQLELDKFTVQSNKTTKDNIVKSEKDSTDKIIDRRKALSDFNAQQDAEDYQMALDQTEQMGKLGQDLTDKERERAIEKTEIAKTAYETLDGYDKVFVAQQLQRADEATQKQIEMERKVQQAKLEIAVQYLNAAQSLTDAMTTSGLLSAEKSFKISKALSITQTTISTIMGVQNALTALSTVPEPFGMALKVANAVAIGAAGAASIAKIASSQFNANAGGGGGGINTPSMPSPSGGGGAMSAPSAQSPNALNLSFLQGNVNTAPLQTYVLAGQVSNAQQAEFKIKNTASILGGG